MRYFPLSIAFIALLASCAEEVVEQKEVIRPVRSVQIGFHGHEAQRSFNGISESEQVIDLAFRSSGVVNELHMKLGQQVKQGELLGKLDNVQARLNYESAVASGNGAESQMNTAKLALDRVRLLYEKGSAPLSDLEAAKNSYKTAQQSYESAKRSIALQREQINYGYLYAPTDGVISAVNVELNENVNPGQQVAVLNAGSDMEISLGLPETVINAVQKDMEVDISFSSIPGVTFKGKVSEASPALDRNTSTYPVRILVLEADERIKSGMAASVSFDLGDHDHADQQRLVVPAGAVGEDTEGRYVLLIEEQGDHAVVKKQHVTIGKLDIDGFEVIEGLSKGDRVATAGLLTLLEGQKVRAER